MFQNIFILHCLRRRQQQQQHVESRGQQKVFSVRPSHHIDQQQYAYENDTYATKDIYYLC